MFDKVLTKFLLELSIYTSPLQSGHLNFQLQLCAAETINLVNDPVQQAQVFFIIIFKMLYDLILASAPFPLHTQR